MNETSSISTESLEHLRNTWETLESHATIQYTDHLFIFQTQSP
jgi:hypothetical protein